MILSETDGSERKRKVKGVRSPFIYISLPRVRHDHN